MDVFEAPIIPCDVDGLPISDTYQPVPDKWAALPYKTRQTLSAAYLARLEKALQPKKIVTPGPGTFTTAYTIEWGRKQGWKLVDRERYDARTKRHHDAMLGMDAIFEDPETMQLIGIQGAGRYEKAEHWERFCQRGGVARAKARNMRCIYLEFVRGTKTPILREDWA